MAALPFIFVTDEIHVISSATLQNAHAPAQIIKTFFKSHVEDIKMEFFKVKSMGSGTAEEWLKGLDETGKERRNDALRWERWELAGGVQRMQSSERTWLQQTDTESKLAINTSSTAPIETIRSLTGNFESQTQGGGDRAAQSSGYFTQTEPVNAPFGKILFRGIIV